MGIHGEMLMVLFLTLTYKITVLLYISTNIIHNIHVVCYINLVHVIVIIIVYIILYVALCVPLYILR